MKKHLYLVLLALYYLTTCYACNKGSIDDNPPPNPIDTTMTTDTMSVDTTASDTVVYEDAPIWLPGGQEHGFAQGLKNGKAFQASSYAFFIRDTDSIFMSIGFNTFTDKGYLRERLTFGEVLASETREYETINSVFELDSIPGFIYSIAIDGGDVSGDRFDVDMNSEVNRIQILEIDLVSKMVKGIFSVAFNIRDPEDKQEPRNPSYCVFEEVYFECKIVR